MGSIVRVLDWLFGSSTAPVSLWEDEVASRPVDRHESLFIVSPSAMARLRAQRVGGAVLPSEATPFRSRDRSG